VSPLLDHINSTAKEWVKHPEKVSIDKNMPKLWISPPKLIYVQKASLIFYTMSGFWPAMQESWRPASSLTNVKDYGLGQVQIL
jgi:hypothetical protein